MMGTGLKRDIGGCAARPLARLLQRQHFGMGLAGPPVPAFAHHLATTLAGLRVMAMTHDAPTLYGVIDTALTGL